MQILIVEDEEKIANLLRKGLFEERYTVDVARDGEEALYKHAVYGRVTAISLSHQKTKQTIIW